MKVLICPDKYKGSLSASEVCSALKQGLQGIDGELKISSHPLADGGDGSIEILKTLYPLDRFAIDTVDPLGRNIIAHYYTSNDSAFIELASASGIVLLQKEERNPLMTSTFGTGLMIQDAIDRGYKKIYLFIGGSATNDAGIGIAHALGFRFLNDKSEVLKPIGLNLNRIKSIEDNSNCDFGGVDIKVLCDVINPMHGPNGAAMVYALQKGASSKEILFLDEGLESYAKLLKVEYDNDLAEIPGMGAAGAVSASLVALLNANIEDGFQMLSKVTELEKAIVNSDLVITGEGKIDKTSFQGKVVGNVLRLCKKHNVPCGIVGGIIEKLEDNKDEFIFKKSIISLAKDQHDAMKFAKKYLVELGRSLDLKSLMSQREGKLLFFQVKDNLESQKYTFERVDFDRPWGGFIVLNERHKKQFIDQYFDGQLSYTVDISMKLSPKMLIVAPQKRLSWQYHHRRSEIWQVVSGPVGVIKSDTDQEAEMKVYQSGDRIELAKGERHRLIGLDTYGIVAEIWVHEDVNNPSDEDDIVRLQDDFGR